MCMPVFVRAFLSVCIKSADIYLNRWDAKIPLNAHDFFSLISLNVSSYDFKIDTPADVTIQWAPPFSPRYKIRQYI